MALGLQTETKSAGDILPIIKYSAQSGDFVRVDRFQTSDGTWDKEEQELAFPMEIIMDLGNIEVGWISFEGGGPSFEMAKLGEQMPERPTAKHSQGFRVKIANKELGLREFSHQAKTVVRVMDALHTEFEGLQSKHKGKVPVVQITGTERVLSKSPKGDKVYKAPVWKISKWVDYEFDAKDEGGTPEAEPVQEEVGVDDPLFD